MRTITQTESAKLKASSENFVRNLLNSRLPFVGDMPGLPQKFGNDEQPLRSELYSVDQMEQHGKRLAALHKLTSGWYPDQLLKRLSENEAALRSASDLLTAAVKAGHHITPAGEWLLDNFYLIDEQIRLAKRHLPKNYSRELPRLLSGRSIGLPRVYDLALEVISHGDGRVDPDSLSRFIAAYQTVQYLKLGELWAIPIMLRLALIENLRRVASRTTTSRIERDQANFWADQILEIAEKDPKSLILVIADMARSKPPMSGSFVAELVRRLQGQSATLALVLPLTWIEQWLSESGLTIAQLVHSDTQQQAIEQVSISNSITSLRFLESINWQNFVEQKSVVEQTLRQDPSGAYTNMDFASRDLYRHIIEQMAKSTERTKGTKDTVLSEAKIAQQAIRLAQEAMHSNGRDIRRAHVGFYLTDDGLALLKKTLAINPSLTESLGFSNKQFRLFFYLSLLTLITIGSTLFLVEAGSAYKLADWLLIVIEFLLLVSTSQVAVTLVNWLVTLWIAPKPAPRMNFEEGIPSEFLTLVVIPSMLISHSQIEALVESLEVRFLANRDGNLLFGLLTDFTDAKTETMPEDEKLLALCQKKIDELNTKYGQGEDKFFLLHRPRRWNPKEQLWMGYERKRGKLNDLNALLRGYGKDRFSLIVGGTRVLSGVKYVITLDTDTQLPRDAGKQLVGAMAHPLNGPIFDNNKQVVLNGYGILQPRVSTNLPGSLRSHYAQMSSSEIGIDPYTRTVSDVYQDLFGEGSFIGKGIYDVDAFEQALKGRFPENRILSHDLLEGCYARSGLLSDVELYEEYPFSYLADMRRRHRWIRGDWQVLPWLFPDLLALGLRPKKNPLSILSRWKIFDNLRRSLVPLAMLLLLVLAWTMLSPAWLWTYIVLAITFVPPLVFSLLEIFRKPKNLPLLQHLSAIGGSAYRHLAQALFGFACLPYEAFVNFDAIACTISRVFVTRRKLLQWSPFSEIDAHNRFNFLVFYQAMYCAPIVAVVIGIFLVLERASTLGIALPILSLWFISPAVAWWISQPIKQRKPRLNSAQLLFLRKLARQTWAFFDTFVGPEDNWLPPDNYQERRTVSLAHRTSPTNIGLGLLSNLSAYDFAYISAGRLIERTDNTLTTMESLERYRGHFFNWYDTQLLRPLSPRYISTVDSGNLSASLLTLQYGLASLADQRIVHPRLIEGISDTVLVLEQFVDETRSDKLKQFRNLLQSIKNKPPITIQDMRLALEQLANSASDIATGIDINKESDARVWADSLSRQCLDVLDEFKLLVPWVFLGNNQTYVSDFPELAKIPTLQEVADYEDKISRNSGVGGDSSAVGSGKLPDQWQQVLRQGSLQAKERITKIQKLTLKLNELANVKYDFLFNKARNLLFIGYNLDEHRLDNSYYDLLASEARLAYFLAIAQDKLPKESWFALGRLLTSIAGEPILVSWSGSMFEYLMPLLLMPSYENTLLDETCKATVRGQIEYAKQENIPWGISESCFNLLDLRLNYQYRSFGVPGLGLKRGLAEDLVVAPYACTLALMVSPEVACLNLERLATDGFLGGYGFYEAIDYTPSRQVRGQSYAIIRSFMAHHQGMSFLALNHFILDKLMPRRFQMDRSVQATAVLLQERIPKSGILEVPSTEPLAVRPEASVTETPVRSFDKANTAVPELHLLSNGRYCVMVTNSGGGYSSWRDLAVTRWREDSTLDNWGTFCYIRDEETGEFWSAAYQPTRKRSESYEAIFSPARVEFRHSDNSLDTHCEIAVSPEDDIELRKVRLTNRTRRRRTITVTSYAEVVLAPAIADALHPAFSNLFVQTKIIEERQAIVCHRRPRSQDENTPWMFHLMVAHGAGVKKVSYETDRMQFVGRGCTIEQPRAMETLAALSGSEGSVLDPVVAVRFLLTIEPEESVIVNIVTGIGETEEACLSLIEKYQDRHLAERVFDLALIHSDIVLRQLNATESDAQLYAHLASSIIYANPHLRADASIIVKNRRGQSGLWGYAISGDLPIVLLQIQDASSIELVRQLIQAHAYWRLKGLKVDLVIWNEDHSGYRQVVQDQILGLIAAGAETNLLDRPGGIFLRLAEQIPPEDRVLIQSVARIIISDGLGSLMEQSNRRVLSDIRLPRLLPVKKYNPEEVDAFQPQRPDLILFNGIGGFTADGREYVMITRKGDTTPAPWVNVVANPNFGSVISESGAGYTFSENAHEFRLTPWHNDPVSDTGGEAIYIRDEETGYFWSPTPLPACGATSYVSRHGFGYSVFEHKEGGINSELWIYVALDAPVKFFVLKIRNESGRYRRLSSTAYVDWVLGDLRAKSAMHIVTEIDSVSGALFARNNYNIDFADRVAFFDVDDVQHTVSGNRTEFLGRNGSMSNPAAMGTTRLSGKVGAALDPCAAIQVPIDLADGQERQIIFRLGVGRNAEDATALANRFKGAQVARRALESVFEHWKHTLGAVHVQTPDPAVNVLTNGWLLYQTIAGRMWARSGYYQSGGAYGFRDQLQDVMAILHTQPLHLREHLLLCASRQFKEGDVQHWWHPPSGRGVRTRCSDDYLWLPFATCRYVLHTGDTGVLDTQTSFLEGRSLNPEEESYYDLPVRSNEVASLYDHCRKAIELGLRFGEHGLPLMGSGDWNDGMNLVGRAGKGESVWLAFFLYDVLSQFSKIANLRGDKDFANHCEVEADQLRQNIEQHGWDGQWYRRAYFDDGAPLGSATNPECQIDSITQSWSVLSGIANSERSRLAMDAADEHLVRRQDKLIQLLAPPFDQSHLNPGYIKGYVPGVRENGGQYTHAAVWLIMAMAALGDNQRAWELWSLINPVNHGRSRHQINTYRVEPYVAAADVYALPPHTGRGGWTWYTGSAGWMYRLLVESFLGLRLDVDKLRFTPCLPADWQSFQIHYRYRETVYHITVSQKPSEAGGTIVMVDGAEQPDQAIHLVDDRRDHTAEVILHVCTEPGSAT